jgi:hypothetical protein
VWLLEPISKDITGLMSENVGGGVESEIHKKKGMVISHAFFSPNFFDI